MSGQNMYRLGDYVYFENAPATAYAIRKIEELNRTANGNVEARVLCFYRRSEVPKTLLVSNENEKVKFYALCYITEVTLEITKNSQTCVNDHL
jgi:metastasis-associated protein MTA